MLISIHIFYENVFYLAMIFVKFWNFIFSIECLTFWRQNFDSINNFFQINEKNGLKFFIKNENDTRTRQNTKGTKQKTTTIPKSKRTSERHEIDVHE